MKTKRITAFMVTIAMVLVTLVFPTAVSAVTSSTVDGFYLTGNNNCQGESMKSLNITDVSVSGKSVTVKVQAQGWNSTTGIITKTYNDFSCTKSFDFTITTTVRGWRYIITCHHKPGHIVQEYTDKDNSFHYGKCKFCGTFSEEHVYDNNCDTICNLCGYERIVEHDYYNANCLTPKVCKVCNHHEGEVSAHNYQNGYCTVCGTEEESGIVHIKTAEQLSIFAHAVKCGFTSLSAVLDNDIDMSEYSDFGIGTSTKPYSGTFDGNGHTIKIGLSGGDYIAPFPYANDATIKNLVVDGTITTSGQFAAGIVSYVTGGNVTIENCMSCVAINSSRDGDGTHGGLVGRGYGNLTVNNCAFLGSITGSKTTNCGGLIGWAASATTINNSYVAASFSIKANSSSNTISRNPGKVTVTNCYYVNELGSTPSNTTYVTKEQVESGELAFLLNGVSGGEKWYQNIDNCNTVDKYPVPNSSHGTLYYGYADCDAEEPTITNTKINTKKYIKGHNGGTANCLSAGYCVDCGAEYIPLNKNKHATDETYYRYIDTKKHGEYHSCCKVLIKEEEHNEKAATCTGINHCNTCNSSYGKIDSTNHTGQLKWVDTGYGEHEYKYTCCGVVTKTEAHTISYKVDDDADTIKVWCEKCNDGTNNWNSGNGTVTLSVDDEPTYNGKAVEAEYTATGFMKSWKRPVDISFKYHCEGGCKNVGEHWVEMTVGDKTVKKNFTIEKRVLSISEIIAENKEYDATNAVTLNTINLDNVVIYQKGDYAAFDIKDSVELDLSKVIVTTTDAKTGNYTTANVTGITLIGSDKDNYTIAESMTGVKIRCSYWDYYDITTAQVSIVPSDQILEGDAELDQTAYTVEFADEKFEIWGIGLKEDEYNKGKILVDTDNIEITYNGEDVTEYFYIYHSNSKPFTSVRGAHLQQRRFLFNRQMQHLSKRNANHKGKLR